ncbi:MAG TPA: hypothetical protein VHP33_01525 [Polyangiaceae bacterium]|nr:hypothetical protein [Polyangiaceae bacterium]
MSRAFLDAVHADPWSDDFVDLATLNEGASDAIEEAIAKLRATAREEPRALRSTSLVVLGSPGAGKTHLFARLRRRIGPRAVFVHIRPLVHAEMTPRFLLGEIVSQLAHTTQGLPQISALVGSLLAYLDGASTGFPTTFLEAYAEMPEKSREERLDADLERALEKWPELDESYLRRLLRAPFATGPTRRALLAWLSGRDCDVAQLQRIGATASLSEDIAPIAIRTLAMVAAPGAPIVLVFDQLENLVEGGAVGSRLLAYAHLTSELVDTVRGLTLVHMALDSEWDRGIEPTLNPSQRSRLVMRRETLALPSAKEREELLRLWCQKLPDPAESFPWPLGESRLARLKAQPGLTPRMLLLECRRALDGEPDVGAATTSPADQKADNDEGLQGEWESCLSRSRRVLSDAAEQRTGLDSARLADGLLCAGRFLADAEIAPDKQGRARLTLKTGQQRAHLAILAEGHPKSLGSALNKLTSLAKDTSIIVIRERARELPPTWKDTLAKRRALLASGRARWVDLDPDDSANLLALDELLQAARSGDVTNSQGEALTEEVVVGWVASELDVSAWPIMKDLIATPVDAEGPEVDPPLALGPSEHSLLTLKRLRIASIDRLVREVIRLEPKATRASVQAELEAAGKRVGWFGRAIVCVKDAT